MADPQPCRMLARRATATLLVVVTLIAAGCGDDNGDGNASGASTADEGAAGASGQPVTPDEMCENGQVPQALAYDLDDGTLRWVSCTDGQAYRSVQAVTDDAVYVDVTAPSSTGFETVALDPADGTVLADAPPPPPSTLTSSEFPVDVDGYQVSGSQEGPTRGAASDGTPLWTQPGVWAYDNVWAIDDGAVFAVERAMSPDQPTRLVAYEIPTGEIRWEYIGDPYGEGLWPWHAEDGRLYTLWGNVRVRDTGTGELIWSTPYPVPTPTSPPTSIGRFAGVAIDDQAVYVGFATEASGGD